MAKFLEIFLLYYNILFFIISIIICYYILKNVNYIDNDKEFYAINDTKDKRYIEYIPKIIFKPKEENFSSQ